MIPTTTTYTTNHLRARRRCTSRTRRHTTYITTCLHRKTTRQLYILLCFTYRINQPLAELVSHELHQRPDKELPK